MNPTRALCLDNISHMKVFLALSRTPHGLLDLAAPILTMYLRLGGFPAWHVFALGVFTVFAGYTAVYAINDIVDYRTDKANADADPEDAQSGCGYLDAVFIRHPMARGFLNRPQAMVWAAAWGLLSLLGAWLLNPLCAWLLLFGCALEVVYCKLLKTTHLRALLNGVVKTLGPLAAVLAVDPSPPFSFMAAVFVCFFCWEIGGQNIPADWHDLDRDRTQNAKTIPLVIGVEKAGRLSALCLSVSVLCVWPLFGLSPLGTPGYAIPATLAATGLLLLPPAYKLAAARETPAASALFNRASYFPALMLGLAFLWKILG